MLGQGPFETSRFVRKRTEECLLNAETPLWKIPERRFLWAKMPFETQYLAERRRLRIPYV